MGYDPNEPRDKDGQWTSSGGRAMMNEASGAAKAILSGKRPIYTAPLRSLAPIARLVNKHIGKMNATDVERAKQIQRALDDSGGLAQRARDYSPTTSKYEKISGLIERGGRGYKV